jgi:nitrogen PTS system EIIA component
MNQVTSILSPERIRIDHNAAAKSELFDDAGTLFASHDGLDPARVMTSLAAREALGSTALGQGVAIPHARLDGLQHAYGAFFRLRPAIPFDAPDGKPVSEALVLLVPDQAIEQHLQLLAEAAQMFNDRRFLAYLRNQRTAADVWQAFADWRP